MPTANEKTGSIEVTYIYTEKPSIKEAKDLSFKYLEEIYSLNEHSDFRIEQWYNGEAVVSFLLENLEDGEYSIKRVFKTINFNGNKPIGFSMYERFNNE